MRGPRKPKRPNACSVGEDEAPKLIQGEMADGERELPETGNEPAVQIESNETKSRNFEE